MKKNATLIASLLFGFLSLLSIATADEVLLKQGDITLRADLNLAAEKTVKDGVVLLLHGTLAHHRMEIISTVSTLMNEAGYNTLAVNLSYAIDKRPEGMMDCKVEHRHRHADAIDEVQAWVDWLKKQGAEKIALWGHSRGGNQIACYAATRDSDLIEKVVLVAPGSLNLKKQLNDFEEKHNTSLQTLIDQSKKMIDEGKGNDLMSVPQFVYCEDAKASAEAFYSYLEDSECRQTPKLLEKINKPTLVVIGSEDTVVTGLEETLAGLKNDKVSLYTIDGSDHFFRDLNADEMVEEINDFLGW